mmetsp:Transcript_36274/g.67602  ORF Transcript_36274/g.67602 Transcript_36274/m.67602 type:complete len:433 (-) Transcript_36274:694-1992(-)
MSDPLNATVFGDGDMTSKIASSGLADNISINKPAMNIATQLHTPLPRPSNVTTHSSSSSANTSMGAVNRSRSTEDPLARVSESVNNDTALEQQQPHTQPPEKKVSPVDMYTSQFISKISTPPINAALISRNISGLHILASCNAWKQVIELSFELMQGNTLNAYQDGQEDLSVVFVMRMIGLFRLKLLDELQQDCSAVLAHEESKLLTLITGTEVVIEAEKGGLGTFLEYPRPPIDTYRVDNIVSLQLLFAEVKVVTGHGDEALNWLYMLKKWLSTPEDTSVDSATSSAWCRAALWKWKVMWSIVNVLIRQRLWRQSIKEMLCIVQEMQQLKEKEDGVDKGKRDQKFSASEILVLCRISRSLIQIGALKSAGQYLDKATMIFKDHSWDGVGHAAVLETHIQITKGLLCFSNDQVCVSFWHYKFEYVFLAVFVK